MSVNAWLLLSGSVLAITPSTAWAQADQSASSGLQEIIVTARRQAETLMDVPVAVSSIGGEALERAGATDLSQIANQAPQVSIGRAESGTGAILTIRGIGTPALDSSLEQSVALNVDGVFGARGQVVNVGFFDLDQVEVLKGPQALFYGKNSPAGVITLRSRDPGNKLEGYVKAGYEFEAREKYVEAAIGGPISDTLKARIAVHASDMRGWLKNVARGYAAGANPFYSAAVVGKDFAVPAPPDGHNNSEEYIGRATVIFEPSDRFTAKLKLSGARANNVGTSAQALCFNPDNHPTGFGVPDLQQTCEFDDNFALPVIPREIADNTGTGMHGGVPYGRDKVLLGSLTMDYNLADDLTLTSVTGYTNTKHKQFSSYNYTSLALINFNTQENGENISQEFRLASSYDGPLNFSLGAYYEDLKRESVNNGIYAPTPPDPVTGRYDNNHNFLQINGKTASLYGQLRWTPIEQIEVSGGVRYTHEKRSANLNQLYGNPNAASFGFIPDGSSIKGRFKDNNWSPEATISYKPNRDSLLFVAYKTGFKSGGISAPGFLTQNLTADRAECDDPASTMTCLLFDSEKVKGFEAGAKTYLAGRTIRLEANIYSYLYSNLQVSTFNQKTSSFFLSNAASARVKGIGLQGEWAPMDGLRFRMSGTVNRARYKAFPTGQCYFDQAILDPAGCVAGVQDLSGRRLTRAPKYTWAAGFSYDMPVTDNLNVGFNGDANFSSSYNTQEDQNPLAVQDKFWLLNAGVRIYQPDLGWELALIGVNLTNEHYRLISNNASGGGRYDFWGVTPRTRQIKLQASYRF
ncbi:Outer membrane receptor proteins, mostly Fe transport [Sphingobium faniae]|nr:Outer membrane receptor proteins, mostly Fe transport [Sphingobium faniae]